MMKANDDEKGAVDARKRRPRIIIGLVLLNLVVAGAITAQLGDEFLLMEKVAAKRVEAIAVAAKRNAGDEIIKIKTVTDLVDETLRAMNHGAKPDDAVVGKIIAAAEAKLPEGVSMTLRTGSPEERILKIIGPDDLDVSIGPKRREGGAGARISAERLSKLLAETIDEKNERVVMLAVDGKVIVATAGDRADETIRATAADASKGFAVEAFLTGNAAFEDWKNDAVREVLTFGFFLLASILLGIRALRSDRALETRSARMEASERRFRTLFEQTADAQLILDPFKPAFADANAAALEMLRIPEKAKALILAHPAGLSPKTQPDGRESEEKAREMIAIALKTGSHRFEWIHLSPFRQPFPAEVLLTPISIDDKTLVLVTWRDISDRKRAEAVAERERAGFEALIRSAPFGTAFIDATGKTRFLNEAFTETLGYRINDVPSAKAWWKKAIPDAARRAVVIGEWKALLEAAPTNAVAMEKDIEILRADRTPVQVRFVVVRLDDGDLVTVEDVTERRRFEERLKLAAAAIESTDDAILVTDADDAILSVNPAFERIIGRGAADVVGKKPDILRPEGHDPAFYERIKRSVDSKGVWQGEIRNRRANGEAFPSWTTVSAIKDGTGRLTHRVSVFSDISALKKSQEELEKLVHFDTLTGLPNRTLFHDRLEHAIERSGRKGHKTALLFLDIDGFKNVNDSFGHEAGDAMLKIVAERLKRCVRADDTVCRLGGDEFAVVLSDIKDETDVIDVVRKILETAQTPFQIEGGVAHVSASVGVAIHPHDGNDATELMRNADAAMYGAKEAGRDAYRFYRPEMTDAAQKRLVKELAIRRGLDADEFEVWYQPQISLHHDGNGHDVTGAEALVRWRDPEHGLIPPSEFIPVAERTGLILKLGDIVLRKACVDVDRWIRNGLFSGRVAVNVASMQIDRGDFLRTLADALSLGRKLFEHLEIEITESLLMANASRASEILMAVRRLGVTVSVDDFGTGYSSLSYLKQLPIDNLKIDQAFVRDLPDDSSDAAITKCIVSMAHSLGFRVIAEGIETEAQMNFLRSEGCDEAQGYHIGRPMPAAEFEKWLKERKPSGK
jgi:diguanylate cyclase (GGDEF)-like protein/PAS domain S-box-containing protein